MNTKDIIANVKLLSKEGKTIKYIKAFLTLEGLDDAQSKEILEQCGVSGKKVGFADSFYRWLAEAPRSKDEASAYILGEGEFGETSNNVQKHLSHYLNIADLASKIWETK